MKQRTIQRVVAPTAMLIGLADELASTCGAILTSTGLKVLRVAHVAAACERIPVAMPQLVLVSTTLPSDDRETITDRCVAVGAEVLRVEPNVDLQVFGELLRNAADTAFVRSLRRGE